MKLTESSSVFRLQIDGSAGLLLPCLSLPVFALVGVAVGLLSFSIGLLTKCLEYHPFADIDAVLIETNGGATTGFGYYVYVLSRGEVPEPGKSNVSLYNALRSECSSGVNLRWEALDHLVVQYSFTGLPHAPEPAMYLHCYYASAGQPNVNQSHIELSHVQGGRTKCSRFMTTPRSGHEC